MKNRFIVPFLLFSLVPVFSLFGIDFNGLTLSSDDKLLYRADFEAQHTLYFTNLSDMSTRQLTAMAEKLYIVENGRTIIALNRMGAARIPANGGLPSPVPGYPSFSSGSIPLKGRLQDLAVSNDGRWILHLEPVSPGYGTLFLINAQTGAKRTISERIELPAGDFPAKWSPASRIFVYEKGGRLFYFPILNDATAIIDERFRMIGPGGINSVSWGQNGHFYYYTGDTLYRVINPELFTRTIYGDFLSIGTVAAVLPLRFEPGFDDYWIAPDAGSILVNKNGKGLFFFLLGDNLQRASPGTASHLPHISVPFGAENVNVLWSLSGKITITYSLLEETYALRFESLGNDYFFTRGISPASPNGALSPDGTKAVFWGANGLELWDYDNWRLIQLLNTTPVLSSAWLNNRQIITGNTRFIEEINISSTTYPRRRICLSGSTEFGFEENGSGSSRVLVRIGAEWFATDGNSAWVAENNPLLKPQTFSSDRYRVFLEPQNSGTFKNIPMIRSMSATGTTSLVSRHTVNAAFTLGREIPVALCFDLYDDDSGLAQVLSALRKRNIRATFFLNGEFIRRNPKSAAAIVNSGHEVGSLFYAPIDLSDTRYRITREFIAQGLARNEDEFHKATGKEISILWHPPFYRTNSAITAAASAAGYLTVSRSFDPGDYLSREEALRLNLRPTSPADMINQIIAKREANAVIPIRLGVLAGGRDSYLFQRIEVLLDALLRSGYVIVPVSTVIR